MNFATTNSHKVRDHYAQADLETTILNALVAAGKDPDRLRIEDLAAIDEFHIRGHSATIDLARDLDIDRHMEILDVGCGLGGASRYLAKEFGCRVTGLDLNADYCRVAGSLTQRLALEALVSFRQGDATALPYPDKSFDIVWSQHAAMNIRDKAVLYHELWRVLKPGGRLALYDILAGSGGDVIYPVPWARDESISFLLTSQQLLDALTETGFETVIWRNVTESGRSWFRRMREKISREGLPAFGLQLLLGPDFRAMAHNQVLNLEEERIALIEVVVRRPGNS
jgi:ubiquinone/menaquinone biosynthesis C-methylase UbiE